MARPLSESLETKAVTVPIGEILLEGDLGVPAGDEQLRGEKRLVIVPGATHLFEEPGALEQVADLAREWFERHLGTASAGQVG
jgi:hypothetical protein